MPNNNNKPLPKLADLHRSPEEAFKDDQLSLLLNQPPHISWVKPYPKVMGINGEYLPIDKTEYLLTVLFGMTKTEILESKVMLNSIAVRVRIHYRHPINGEWYFQDGEAAVPVQLNAGAPASDLSQIKARGVQVALPVAISIAKKNAADNLGKIFGRDLNRKDTLMFTGAFYDPDTGEGYAAPNPPDPYQAPSPQPSAPQPQTQQIRQQDMPWTPPQQQQQPQPQQSAPLPWEAAPQQQAQFPQQPQPMQTVYQRQPQPTNGHGGQTNLFSNL